VTLGTSASLDRRLGPLDAAVIVVSNVIGVGIFTTPGVVAGMLPNPAAMLGVWVAGGALAFAGALAYAELAARRPQAGGEYVYLRESFGGLAAFLTGWTSFVAGFSGAMAASAVGIAAYLDRFLPGAGNATAIAAWSAGPFAVTVSPRSLVAIGTIVAMAMIHARGLGPGRLFQNALTFVKIGALTIFVLIGFLVAGPVTKADMTVASAPISWHLWLLALVPVMFSYSGWNAAVYVAEEVRSPARNLPRALGLGTITVVLLYLALNALYLRVVPSNALAGSISVGALAAASLFGSAAGTIFGALAIIIVLGSLSAMTLAGPRVYFAMARDGAFFPAAARVHPRYRTPAVAIFAQAAWSALLVVSGTFEQLLTYTGFAVILFSALAVLSLFVVRRRPVGEKSFRTWGYPWAPASFCLVGFAIVVNTILQAPRVAFAGLAVMAAGIPIYWWTRLTKPATVRGHDAPSEGPTA
jgi:APA family basic amino acid/polyamine antiporter